MDLIVDSVLQASVEASNKVSLIRTFPNHVSDEASTPQQMPVDKSPDVIPHSIGKLFTLPNTKFLFKVNAKFWPKKFAKNLVPNLANIFCQKF